MISPRFLPLFLSVPAVVAVVEIPTDAAITERVRQALQTDEASRYEAGGVQVSTRNAVVSLVGTVSREAIRQRMELVAHSVGGVARVVNLLRVETNSNGPK